MLLGILFLSRDKKKNGSEFMYLKNNARCRWSVEQQIFEHGLWYRTSYRGDFWAEISYVKFSAYSYRSFTFNFTGLNFGCTTNLFRSDDRRMPAKGRGVVLPNQSRFLHPKKTFLSKQRRWGVRFAPPGIWFTSYNYFALAVVLVTRRMHILVYWFLVEMCDLVPVISVSTICIRYSISLLMEISIL